MKFHLLIVLVGLLSAAATPPEQTVIKAALNLSEFSDTQPDLLRYRSFATSTNYVIDGFLALYDTLDVIPPDSNGAVSQEFIVTALNSQVRIQRKSGEQVKTISITDFWSPVQIAAPFDPRTLFDPIEQRWIMAAAGDRTGQSSLLLGVSANEDPGGTWYLYRILGNTGPGGYIDFPALGFNRDSVVVSCLVRASAGNQILETRVYRFDKGDLYRNGAGAYNLLNYLPEYLPVPAVAMDQPDPLLLLSAPVLTNTAIDELQVLSLSVTEGSASLQVLNVFSNLPPWAAVAPNNGNLAPQLGSTQRLHLQDSVIANVVQKNDTLWFAQMVFLPPENPDRAAIQWGSLTVSNIAVLARIEDPAAETSYGYPSIAVNDWSQVCIGFTRFSETDYPSAACVLIPDYRNPEQFHEIILKRGEGPYFRTSGTVKNRWGDYSSTHVDPADGRSFWTIQEYAAIPEGNPEINGSGRWSTWWGHVALPLDPAGRITGIRAVEPLTLTVSTSVGFTYELQSASTLPGEWQVLQVFDGTGEDLTLEDLRPKSSARFYRVAVVPE